MNGDKERDAALQAVNRNTDPLWSEAYKVLAEGLFYSLKEGETFTGARFNEYIVEVIGYPHTKNALSANFSTFIRALLRDEQCKMEGFVKSHKASSRSHYIKQYVKL